MNCTQGELEGPENDRLLPSSRTTVLLTSYRIRLGPCQLPWWIRRRRPPRTKRDDRVLVGVGDGLRRLDLRPLESARPLWWRGP